MAGRRKQYLGLGLLLVIGLFFGQIASTSALARCHLHDFRCHFKEGALLHFYHEADGTITGFAFYETYFTNGVLDRISDVDLVQTRDDARAILAELRALNDGEQPQGERLTELVPQVDISQYSSVVEVLPSGNFVVGLEDTAQGRLGVYILGGTGEIQVNYGPMDAEQKIEVLIFAPDSVATTSYEYYLTPNQ